MKVGEFAKLHRKSAGMGHPPLWLGIEGWSSGRINGQQGIILVEKVRTQRTKPPSLLVYHLVALLGQSLESGHRFSLQYRFQGSAHQQKCRARGRRQCGQFAQWGGCVCGLRPGDICYRYAGSVRR